MIGRRVANALEPHLYQPGDYGFWDRGGHWNAETPNGHGANLGSHQVVEHEDGSITVTPSIAVSTSREGQKTEVYHGYLERGVWRLA